MSLEWLDTDFEQDLVSVIIPCHNQERLLPECLQSIIAQNYRPIEIIIVNDGSDDKTITFMDHFQHFEINDVSVQCIHQTKHGAPHARNRGCRLSKGEFIQFLDGDDILCPEKLTQQVFVMKENKHIDVVYGDAQYLITFNPRNSKRGRIISGGHTEDIIASLLRGAWVPVFSYLSRRPAIQRCGPWNVELKILQDIDFFLRMAMSESRFCYKQGINGFYRKHSLSSIAEQSASIRSEAWINILSEAEHNLRISKRLTDNRVSAMIECYRRIGRQIYSIDIECFKDCLDNILRLSPSFLPNNKKAKVIASIIGFNNYEFLAAMIHSLQHKHREPTWT